MRGAEGGLSTCIEAAAKRRRIDIWLQSSIAVQPLEGTGEAIEERGERFRESGEVGKKKGLRRKGWREERKKRKGAEEQFQGEEVAVIAEEEEEEQVEKTRRGTQKARMFRTNATCLNCRTYTDQTCLADKASTNH